MKRLGLLLTLTAWSMGSLAYSQDYTSTYLSPADVAQMVLSGQTIPQSITQSPIHPDYPVYIISQALEAHRKHDPRAAVRLLEPLLIQSYYGGLSKKESERTAQLLVGTIGSFGFWRELIYLTLGQCYYELGETENAIPYLRGIPETSPFAALAQIEAVWALLKLRQVETAGEINNKIDQQKLTDTEKAETQIAKAFLALEKGRTDEALLIASSLNAPKNLSSELASLRFKVIAQAEFQIYLKQVASLSVAEKRANLSKLLQHIEAIHTDFRDADFSVLASEAYWHLASLIRMDNPTESRNALKKANDWISPWIDRSIRANAPLFSEGAFFLSVAVLWEQERKEEAIPRLLAIPRFFPQGEFREDTYQLLADYYFDAGDFKRALGFYTELARVGSEEKAAYGVYKAAWTFYNQESKWKALRHLERLVLYYRDKTADGAAEDAAGLIKESQQDMLLLLAELLPHSAAIQEFSLFKYSREKRTEISERLAKVYKEIGRYEDSIAVLQTLLAENPKSVNSYEWLKNLMITLLSAEKRDLLSVSLDRYWPVLPKDDSKESLAAQADLTKQIAQLLITIHREARKTDDPEYWRATDALYSSFEKRLPNSTEGDVWYFGAQRKEQLKDLWGATEWYRRAGSVSAYSNAKDSALSVLRLVKSIGDDPTLVKKSEHYKTLAQVSRWYIDQYNKTPERKIAEFLYIENLYQSANHPEARQYISKVIGEEGPSREHQDQYLAYNRHLYEARQWPEAHQLAIITTEALADKQGKADPKFVALLAKFTQESSFEAAFQLEKSKPDQARIWYGKAITQGTDDLITLKAWHNLIISYKSETERSTFTKTFIDFQSQYHFPRTLSELRPEKSQLLTSIFLHAAHVWEKAELPLDRAKALSRAADFEIEVSRAENLRWDAFIQNGIYNDAQTMRKELSILQKNRAAILRDPKNVIAASRLLLWNQDFIGAWEIISPILEKSEPPPSTWTALADLFTFTRGLTPNLHKQVSDFIVKRRKELAGNSVMRPILDDLLNPERDLKQVMALAEKANHMTREVASRSVASAPGGPQAELKARVDAVGNALKTYEAQETDLAKYFSNPALPVSITAICSAANLKAESAKRLEHFKNPTIASKQWPDFLKKLDGKIRELNSDAAKLSDNCEAGKRSVAFMNPVTESKSPLCGKSACFPAKPKSDESIVELERGWKKTPSPRLSKIYQYLSIGAWAAAESLAFSTPSIKERSLLLGVIRLALGDLWNATSLLREARLDTEAGSHAKLLLARIAWRNGYPKLAREEITGAKKSELLDWELTLLNEMSLGV